MIDFQSVGPAGYIHLGIFGLALPLIAVRSAQLLERTALPPRQRFFVSVILQQLFFIALSAAVVWVEKIELSITRALSLQSILIAAAYLGLMIGLMLPHWKQSIINRERKAYLFMPRGSSEKMLWVLISLAAGIGEELSYRGVMWELLTRLTGSLWTAALIASVIFAFGHFVQGWKSMGAIFGFALIFHFLVLITGSLAIAMAVHFLYDLVAGLSYSYFGEKFGYPNEALPP